MLCRCGHAKRRHHSPCDAPKGEGNGKTRMVCGCVEFRPARRQRDGLAKGRWDTRNLRCRNMPDRDRRRAEEKKRHGQKGRRSLENRTRLSPVAETAVERMRRRLRGEGI